MSEAEADDATRDDLANRFLGDPDSDGRQASK
jgi:hypothetical protein